MLQLFIKLHFAVFLAGFTGVFGRLITYDAFILVFIRFSIAATFIYFVLKAMHKLKKFTVRHRIYGIITGAILATHLVLFYLSIKLSNISIGTVTLAITGFFTAILEPLILRCRFDKSNFIYTLLAVLGLFLIFNFDTKFRLGIAVGIASSLFSSLFAVYNKKFSYRKDPYTFVNYEMLGGFLFMLLCAVPYIAIYNEEQIEFRGLDIFYLVLLSTVFTVFLYLLVVQLSEKLSAFTISLTFNLEPVYSILIAMILFNENMELNFSFYLGVALMLVSVFLQNRKIKNHMSD